MIAQCKLSLRGVGRWRGERKRRGGVQACGQAAGSVLPCSGDLHGDGSCGRMRLGRAARESGVVLRASQRAHRWQSHPGWTLSSVVDRRCRASRAAPNFWGARARTRAGESSTRCYRRGLSSLSAQVFTALSCDQPDGLCGPRGLGQLGPASSAGRVCCHDTACASASGCMQRACESACSAGAGGASGRHTLAGASDDDAEGFGNAHKG